MTTLRKIIKKTIPRWLINSIRLQINKIRFPNSNILTPMIGGNVSIEAPCSILTDTRIGHDVEIGKYSYVNNFSIIGPYTRIGRFCSIAYGVRIGMEEHPTNYISTSPFIYGINNIFGTPSVWNEYQKPVSIANDVWIGANVLITQGVNIGNGVIIAAGSVVTKDVDPYDIVGGVPAKLIKKRFDSDTIKKLEQDKWWEWDASKIKKNQSMFLSKDEWIEKY